VSLPLRFGRSVVVPAAADLLEAAVERHRRKGA
jgi:hypothetical protein